MSLLVPSSSSTIHEPLPSLPPSPTEEEDLGGASLWRDDGEEEALRHHSVKGKERAREISLDENEMDSSSTSEDTLAVGVGGGGGYPPTKGEEEEARRVEENLRRLEHAERQRRKAARESAAFVAPSSVVNDVSRRASSLLSNKLRNTSSSSPNKLKSKSNSLDSTGSSRRTVVHAQLGQSSDDALPLSEFNGGGSSNMLVSPATSKPPSPTGQNHGTNSKENGVLGVPTIVENPFEPPDSATPLRGFPPDDEDERDGDGMESSAVMRPSSPPPAFPPGLDPPDSASPFNEPGARPPDRPTLQATSSFSSHPNLQSSQIHHPLGPPPRPLDLPPPKTPPPRTDVDGTPVVTVPPKRLPVPVPSATRRGDVNNRNGQMRDQMGSEQLEEQEEHRWWTDWLCGCREEKDRDNAGRTNPFE
ncbi:uncharacterized protein FOMMEDRAFT_20161 [Fomitiporia mediterranea MF3/22]|uniref:uncharacterized protein n=1 Tax=Fomitiporia mediterranea (strain MF3/22) TaxID=694068 RepID=UPI0004409536|nr:uncharacterized protein FOMMEDRAFT_20161 [Fomitiporia mediterranea MF3/22]EJD02984.1 hypothetical protein FOMMEDRAFT_20161 [Fomitiporia mediterranea MF3/22]